MTDLWTALSLAAVIEGLLLFAFPGAWRRTAEHLLSMPPTRLRVLGACVIAAGLLGLYLMRG